MVERWQKRSMESMAMMDTPDQIQDWMNALLSMQLETIENRPLTEEEKAATEELRRRAHCPKCKYDKYLQEHGFASVRDMLDRCSKCGSRIMSIDYVHTCRGGDLCESCWIEAELP